MSYTGIRKGSIVQNEEGNFCFKCDCYDSSITSYSGGRVWYNNELLYASKNFKTKAELERALFEDFLDGNLHGSYGKFSPLNWHNCKIVLPDNVMAELKRLEDIKWSIPFENREERSKACEEYNNYRYSEYEKAWKLYLKNKK